jgi:hypothetical protein
VPKARVRAGFAGVPATLRRPIAGAGHHINGAFAADINGFRQRSTQFGAKNAPDPISRVVIFVKTDRHFLRNTRCLPDVWA